MADKAYEGMFLLDSGRFATDPDGTTRHLLDIVQKAGGTVVAHRPWQDGKLAFPIAGQRKGLHYLIYFRLDGRRLPEIDRSCKLSDLVLRHLVINQPEALFDQMVAALTAHEEAEETASESSEETSGESSSKSQEKSQEAPVS